MSVMKRLLSGAAAAVMASAVSSVSASAITYEEMVRMYGLPEDEHMAIASSEIKLNDTQYHISWDGINSSNHDFLLMKDWGENLIKEYSLCGEIDIKFDQNTRTVTVNSKNEKFNFWSINRDKLYGSKVTFKVGADWENLYGYDKANNSSFLIGSFRDWTVSPRANIYESGNGQATLTWGKVDGAEKYAVSKYSKVNGKESLKLITSDYKNTSITLKDLEYGKTHQYLVQAYVNGRWSDYTENSIVSVDITNPEKACSPTTAAVFGDGKVTLYWETVPKAEKYAVYKYAKVDGKDTFKLITSDYKDTSVTLKGLTNGTKYQYFVTAYVDGKWTDFSSDKVVSGIPNGETKPVITETKPTVTAEAGDGKAVLRWTAVPNAAKYGIYSYSKVNGTDRFKPVNDSYTGTSMTISGLTNGTTYQYLVRAYVNGKWTSYTNSDIVSVKPVKSESVSFALKAASSNGKITLNWTAVPNAQAYGVAYYSAGKWKANNQNILPASSTTWTSPKLTVGKSYKIAVAAKVNGKWNTDSAIKTAVTITVH